MTVLVKRRFNFCFILFIVINYRCKTCV